MADIVVAAAGLSPFAYVSRSSSHLDLHVSANCSQHGCLGIPNLITADMIKEGAAVIDVGINRVQDPVTGKSRLVGDVDFEGKRDGA